MGHPQLATFAILALAFVLFLSDRLRADLVALMCAVLLGATGVLTQQEALAGFSRSAVITLLGIFILTEGLRRTGATELFGALLLRVAKSDEKRMLIVVMLAGAGLSLFMNNIAAASVLLPAVSSAARKSRISQARLLMPLAFATILGGMATLLTTTNIVVSSTLRDRGLPGFGLLDFLPIGVPIVIAGTLYMMWWGRKLLPAQFAERQETMREAEADLLDFYGLGERLFRARVPTGSALIDRSLETSGLREKFRVTVIAIERGGTPTLSPTPQTVIKEGDVLLVRGDLQDFIERDVDPHLEIMPARDYNEADISSPEVLVVEAMLSPRSTLLGQTLQQSRFRTRFGMNVLAIWRAGQQITTGIRLLPLEFGDALLLQGPRQQVEHLVGERDLILLADREELAELPPLVGMRGLALLIMIATLACAAFLPDYVGEVMLGGAIVMLLANILSMDEAYDAVEWKTIFLVAGVLPLGTAMTKTGASLLLTDWIFRLVGHAGPWILMAGLFFLAVLLTQAMAGAAVAAVIAPVAIAAAQQVNANPRALAMAVALATSMAFITPLGHPVNMLVMGQGGYRFKDYGRVGGLLTLLLSGVVLLLLPFIWRLR
jgi:di/tricarboxylate transporter